jgi:2-dehydropantoate 2-reductase
MRFLILGAGGLGGYFGGMLVRSGAEVGFLVRPRRAAQLAGRNLVIKEPAGDLVIPVTTLTAGEIDGKYDVVLLTCKAYDLDGAADAIAPAIGSGSTILPVLNGVNQIDILRERFGSEHVLGGMIIVRAEMAPNGDIVRPPINVRDAAAFGELTGARTSRCEAIHAALMSAGLPSRISDDILAIMDLTAQDDSAKDVSRQAGATDTPASPIARCEEVIYRIENVLRHSGLISWREPDSVIHELALVDKIRQMIPWMSVPWAAVPRSRTDSFV